jgi:hypothetical protein
MSGSNRRVAALLVVAALTIAAIALVAGSNPAVSAFIAGVAGIETDDADAAAPAAPPTRVLAASAGDAASWDPDDGEDPDAGSWTDPVVRSLRVRVMAADGAPAHGVPVAILGARDGHPLIAGPKATNADGRVRFPIGVEMEQQHDVLVAARAIPGRAGVTPAKVVLDQSTDVTLTIDAGIRGLIHVVDPDGRSLDAVARARKAILDDGTLESGPYAEALSQVFAETTPRAIRTSAGLALAGLRAPDEITLFVSAPGFAPAWRPVQVPAQPPNPLAIEVRLDVRTSAVKFEAGVPAAIEKATAFSCHRVEGSGVVMAAGSDEVPAQRSPRFCVDVAPNDAQRLEVYAWVDGRIQASAELDVPALREGEILDVGTLRLELLPVVLAGSVVGEDHAPLANATIEAIGRGRIRDLAATTGADGRFALRAPGGRGPYQVSAHAPGRVSEKISGVAEPAHDLRFVLEPSGSIEGSVMLIAGAERLSVRATADGRAPFVTAVKTAGSFAVTGLPRGVYTVVVEGDGIFPVSISGVVVNPPEVTRDGRLDRVRLRGRGVQGQP